MAAYLVSVCEVTNPHDDFKKYIALSEQLLKKHNGQYVVRGPEAENLEGDALNGKVLVVTRFETMEKLKGFYESDEYQKNIRHLRDGSGIYDIACYEEAAP